LVIYGGSGGALVLLLIVRNFQQGACNGVTAKFAVLSIFLFGEYEYLYAASCGSLPQAGQEAASQHLRTSSIESFCDKADVIGHRAMA
jgi:hypothetical protein